MEGGALRPGSRLLLVPSNATGAVKSLDVGGRPAALARAGDTVEVVLAPCGDIDPSALLPGCVLCHPAWPAPLVRSFEARVVVLPDVAVPLLRGAAVTLHAHAAREAGTVTQLVATLNPKTGEVLKVCS